jgi:UDP-N-acetylmuramyl-tripeptide synthetase
MMLAELLRDVEIERVSGPLDVAITEVRDDSRAVGAGDLFIAMPGLTVDGHAFVAEVASRGAAAIVVERADAAEGFAGTSVVVRSAATALARIAANRFGNPASRMTMVGVTGTNGKTTTTYLIESILRAAGRRVGVIGTVNYRYDDAAGLRVAVPANFTTPAAVELHRVLAEMQAAGCTHVVMETSSHALSLGRLDGVDFRVGAFTNLTQDHLDFHGSMDEYYDAKARLLRRQLHRRDGVGVVLVDGEYGDRMANEVSGERVLVSLSRQSADVAVRAARTSIDGIVAELASPLGSIRIRSKLLGAYNLANIAVASAVAVALGVDVAAIERGVEALAGVPGRVERVDNARGLAVLVDYAHTPDALENVIAALRPLTAGRLLCVFGCGGDRDRGKRPKMGRAVAERADLAFVTSDNPRTEDPAAIVDEILAGVCATASPALDRAALAQARKGFFVEVDRRTAIAAAVAAMREGDVLLVAGKGHEDYQIIGRTKHPFDDRAVAGEAIAALAADPQRPAAIGRETANP